MQADTRDLFQANLAALAEKDGQLAQHVESIAVPDNYQLQPAEDGTSNFRDCAANDGSGWFGHTGVPTVRDTLLAEQFQIGRDNALLVGPGQGLALKLILERLSAHQAVFVLEDQPLQLALLLRLHDLAEYLRSGRLVFVCDPDPLGRLEQFLCQNPGYAVPAQMMSWPWLDGQRLGELPLRVQQLARKINRIRQHQLEQLYRRAGRRSDMKDLEKIKQRFDQPAELKVLVLCAEYHPSMAQVARHLTRALQACAVQTTSVLPDRPEHASLIPYARSLAEAHCDLVLLVGRRTGACPLKLPDNLPVISVIAQAEQLPAECFPQQRRDDVDEAPPHVDAAGSAPALNRHELLVLADPLGAEQAENVALPKDRVMVLDPAVNAVEVDPATFRCNGKILLVGDYPDSDPEKHGVRQESHKVLWKAVEHQIRRSPDGYWLEGGEGYLRAAEKASGIELRRQELREAFLATVDRALAPAVLADTCARQLQQSAVQFEIWGRNWSGNEQFALRTAATPADEVERARRACEYQALVIADVKGDSLQLTLDVLAAGVPVLLPKPVSHQLRQKLPVPLPKTLVTKSQDLSGRIRRMIDNDEPFLQAVRQMARRLEAEHTYRHRIHAMFERMRTILRCG